MFLCVGIGLFWHTIIPNLVTRYPSKSNMEVFAFIVDGNIMEKPPGCPSQLYAYFNIYHWIWLEDVSICRYVLMKQCWARLPIHRPTFEEVHKRITGILDFYPSCIVRTCINCFFFCHLQQLWRRLKKLTHHLQYFMDFIHRTMLINWNFLYSRWVLLRLLAKLRSETSIPRLAQLLPMGKMLDFPVLMCHQTR